MAIVRDFENGVVLVNASETSVTVDLPKILPAIASGGLWRLRADPASYSDAALARELLAYNDGRREDPAAVVVPERNGLFLSKSPP